MTKTGHELSDVGRGLSWAALDSFIKNTSADSALVRETRPDLYIWSTTAKTNAILADIFDMLASINANLCAKGSGKKAKKPKPYPRPGKNKNARKVGTAMSVSDLHKKIFGR